MERDELQAGAASPYAPLGVLGERLRTFQERMGAVPPGDLDALRKAFKSYATGSLPPSPPRPDIRIAQADACPAPATWFIPQHADLHRSTLYLHGGGFLAGDVEMYAPLVAELAAALRQRVLFLSYSLAPEAVFPRPLEDALAAYAWLDFTAATEGPAALHPSVVGDSCGAALALSLAAARRDRGLSLPFALVGLSPALDFSGTIAPDYPVDDMLLSASGVVGQCDMFRGKLARVDPQISPAFLSPTGLPPTLLQTGTGEYSRAGVDHYARGATAVDAPVVVSYWTGMPHAWHLCLDILPEAKAALDAAAAFVLRPESRTGPGQA